MSLARLWQRQGRRDEARDALAAIYGTYTEGFTTPDLVDAKALLECLAEQAPDRDGTRPLRERSRRSSWELPLRAHRRALDPSGVADGSQPAVNALATGEDLPPAVTKIDIRSWARRARRRPLETVRVLPVTQAMQPSTGRNRRRLPFRLLLAVALMASSSSSFAQERPTIGVAFGGGSARGIAHVGVIRWFEEHHIPIDVAAGTSMGGLIGGSFATGMDAAGHPGDAAGHRLGPDVRVLELCVQEHPSQGRRPRLPVAPRVRPQEGHRAASLAEQRPSGGPAALPGSPRPITPNPTFDDAAHALQGGGRGPAHGRSGRARSRIAGARDARHDVAPGRLPARRNRWPGAGRWRRDEQRALPTSCAPWVPRR